MEKESLLELIDSKVRKSIYYDPKAISIKGSKKDKRYEISFFRVGVLKIIESTSPVTYKVRNLILDSNKDDEMLKLFIDGKEWSDVFARMK